MELFVHGTDHKDQSESNFYDLFEENVPDSFEAHFLEIPDSEESITLRAFLANPTVSLMFWFMSTLSIFNYIIRKAGFIPKSHFPPDFRAAAQLAQDRGLHWYCVDLSHNRLIIEHSKYWSLPSWLILLISFYIGILIANGPILIASGSLLVCSIFGGIFVFWPFVKSTTDARNLYMLQKITKISDENEIESGVVFVGDQHVEGIIELINLSEHDLVGYERHQYSGIKQFLK